MTRATTATARWQELDGLRSGFLTRCEKYAYYTLPQLLPPLGYRQESESLQHDNHSFGAQALLGLVNKLMLALFAPSRPFVRYELTPEALAQMLSEGMDQDALSETLSQAELDTLDKLESLNIRPKLYELLKHLVGLGNVLLYHKPDGSCRIMGLRTYVVKRNVESKVIELLVQEELLFDELEDQVRAALPARYTDESRVRFTKWCNLVGKQWVCSQWVDDVQLPEQFNGVYSEDAFPYSVQVWDLADSDDYGTGLVEAYAGDFGALSVLSEAELNTAILISEFRWLVNPTGMTSPEDFENRENGAVVPGMADDVQLMHAASKSADLQAVQAVTLDRINRIGRGFLATNSVVRNAERVTREEIRMLANDLETSFGGIYSRLSVELQLPLVKWLLNLMGIGSKIAGLEIKIISGMAALSRAGDLDNLRGLIQDLASVAGLPPLLLERLNMETLISKFAQGWGVSKKDLIVAEEVVQARRQAAQQQQVAQEVATAQGTAQAQAAAQQSTQGDMNG